MRNEAADMGAGFVYMQTNEAERNRLLAFRRAGDGTPTPADGYEAGGAGDGKPHLTSQGSVVPTGDGRYLLVTRPGTPIATAKGKVRWQEVARGYRRAMPARLPGR